MRNKTLTSLIAGLIILITCSVLWYHRAIILSGDKGLTAQAYWIAGYPIDGGKLSKPIPQSASQLPKPQEKTAQSSTANKKDYALNSVKSFSILKTSKEEAEAQAKEIISRISSKSNADLINEAAEIDPSYINDTKDDMQEAVEKFGLSPEAIENLKIFRAKLTIAQYLVENSFNVSYGTGMVVAWLLEKDFHEFLQNNLTEEQFQAMLGIAKWQLWEKPHPYDDPDGIYWPQSEVFGKLSIDESISTEEELFKHVSYEKLQRVLEAEKEYENSKRDWLNQRNTGMMTSERHGELLRSSLSEYYGNLKNILSPDEASTIGYSIVYEKREYDD